MVHHWVSSGAPSLNGTLIVNTIALLTHENYRRCSRGIGLQFVKQLTAEPHNIVIASCRNPEAAEDLNAVKDIAKGQLHIVKLNVTDEESIKAAAQAAESILGSQGLDYLLNNAAIVSKLIFHRVFC